MLSRSMIAAADFRLVVRISVLSGSLSFMPQPAGYPRQARRKRSGAPPSRADFAAARIARIGGELMDRVGGSS